MILSAITLFLLSADWHQGTFEEALEKARKEDKIVFVDFWASWCGACRRFDVDVLSDAGVIAETRDLVCMKIDAQSTAGVPLAARYGVRDLPSLVFVEPDGLLRERLDGYRSATQFVHEIRRIRANEGTTGEVERKLVANPDDVLARIEFALRLKRKGDPRWERELQSARQRLERGVGFDPKSPDERFAIGRRLRLFGDEKGYQEQLAAIRILDPEGRSDSMRRLKLNTLLEEVNSRYRKEQVFDPSPIQRFLGEERSPLVLFDGYSMLREMAGYQAEDAQRRDQAKLAADRRAEAREYGRRAFEHCPPDRIASFGREIARELLADPRIAERDRDWMVEAARKAAEAAPRSADHLELLGRCLEKASMPADALAAYRRALEIDPSLGRIRDRIADLER